MNGLKLAGRFCHHASGLVTKQKVNNNTICKLILNNPKKRNALSLEMLDALKAGLTECSKDAQCRVIVLSAQPPVFSAGHDLKELTSKTGEAYHAQVFRRCTEVMSLVQDIDLPVVAQVRGLAAAAGCQLIASCDIVVAGHTAQFSTPGAKAGLFCSTPGIAVARAAPAKVSMYMLLTGDTIDAETALRSGLVSKVVPDDRLESETLAVAQKICDLSKPVISLGKKFFYKQVAQSRDQAYKEGEKVMVDNLQLRDGQEGIASFIEKRKPIWSNKDEKVH